MTKQLIPVSKTPPPQWILDAVLEEWGVKWESTAVFTYGDTIHTYNGFVTPDLYVHEHHHSIQQAEYGSPEEWWKRYLHDAEFRLDQELECYRLQYKWIAQRYHRSEVYRFLLHYAKTLSGPMYGNLISLYKAIEKIRN